MSGSRFESDFGCFVFILEEPPQDPSLTLEDDKGWGYTYCEENQGGAPENLVQREALITEHYVIAKKGLPRKFETASYNERLIYVSTF